MRTRSHGDASPGAAVVGTRAEGAAAAAAPRSLTSRDVASLTAAVASGERPRFLFFWRPDPPGHGGSAGRGSSKRSSRSIRNDTPGGGEVAAVVATAPGGGDPAAHGEPSRMGPWVCSQWAALSFTDPANGQAYSTAEHWMMAGKARLFDDDEYLHAILADPSPRAARQLGRGVRGFDTDVWDAARFEIVVSGNVLKFGGDAALRRWLLGTADRVLVEASPSDATWGIGLKDNQPEASTPAAWRGTNLLGFALMEARARLAASEL